MPSNLSKSAELLKPKRPTKGMSADSSSTASAKCPARSMAPQVKFSLFTVTETWSGSAVTCSPVFTRHAPARSPSSAETT